MTSIINTLKLTAARKARTLPDVVKRRNKLLLKLSEQRALAAALQTGVHYSPKRLRSFTDINTGERIVKEGGFKDEAQHGLTRRKTPRGVS
jgi:hypothetical protein